MQWLKEKGTNNVNCKDMLFNPALLVAPVILLLLTIW